MNKEKIFVLGSQLAKTKKMATEKKSAQLEMIGLVIIVIIVITALLIFAVYKISHPVKNLQKTYVNNEIATNLLISMMWTDVEECPVYKLKDLVIDCAKPVPSKRCGDRPACEMANKTIAEILDNTLVKWEMSYNLSIDSPYKGVFINFVNLNCTSKVKERVEGFEILSLYPINSTTELRLGICTI
jgi:hypothetical protein